MDTMTSWKLIENGMYDSAYADLSRQIASSWPVPVQLWHNRGLCLLNMDRPEQALADFRKTIRRDPDSDSGPIAAGVALWCLDRAEEAVEVWRRAEGVLYTDAGGGMEVPALLYFAAGHLRDATLEREAKHLLVKRLARKRATAWPGPIGAYILGKMREDA